MFKKYKSLFDRCIEESGELTISSVKVDEEDIPKELCDMDDNGNLYIKLHNLLTVLRISSVMIMKALTNKFIDVRLFGCVINKDIMHIGTFLAIADYFLDTMDNPEKVDPKILMEECFRTGAKDASELKRNIVAYAFSLTKTDEDFPLALVYVSGMSMINLAGIGFDSFEEIQRIVS